MTARAILVALVLLAASSARAQDASVAEPTPPPTARIRQLVSEGDLTEANAVLDEAFRAERLSREELAELFALRALLAYADDRLGLLEESLAAVATLTPAGWVHDDFPPPVRRRLEEIRETAPPISLGLEIVTEVRDDRRVAHLVSEVESDPGRVVREVRVRARVGDGDLRLLEEGDELVLGDPHADTTVRYALEGVGLGGAAVAHNGTMQDSLTLDVAALPTDDTFLHVALVTIGAVVAAGVLAFAFAWVATDGLTLGRPTSVTCCGR